MNDWRNQWYLGKKKMLFSVHASCLRCLRMSQISGVVVTRTEGTYLGYRDNSFLPPLDMLGYPFMTLNLVLMWGG